VLAAASICVCNVLQPDRPSTMSAGDLDPITLQPFSGEQTADGRLSGMQDALRDLHIGA
jgi:hypothetical protein